MRWRTVADVMTRSVVSAYPDAPFNEIVHVMIERGITAMPVIDEDHHVMGLVSESDLLAREAFEARPKRRRPRRRRDGRGMRAADLMTAPAVSVRPETTVVQAARLLDRRRIKRLPVVDDEGRLVGIVSRRDLLRVFALAEATRPPAEA